MKLLCDEIVYRGLDKRCQWLSETRCDRLDKETADLMYYGGCRRVLMGIESGVDLLLGNEQKYHDTESERVWQTLRMLVADRWTLHDRHAGETPEMTRETVEFSCDLELVLLICDYGAFLVPNFDDRWQKDLFRDD